MTLVVLQLVGQMVLVAQTPIVQPIPAAEPVAMLQFTIALQVVLTSGKVPHEVAPVHEVALIADEEAQVLQLRRNLHGNHLATAVEGFLVSADIAHPTLISTFVTRAVHTREEHVLGVFILVLGAYDEVFVLFIGRSLLLALPNGITLRHNGVAILTILLQCYLRGVGRSIEQWALAILLTTQVFTQGKDVLW